MDTSQKTPDKAVAPAQSDADLISYARIDKYLVVNLTRRMAALVASGINIARALETIVEQEQNPHLKFALGRCCDKLQGGWPLSRSLGLFPRLFSPIYCSMVQIGESIGDMPGMLNRLSDFLDRDYKMEKRAQAAMVYPAFICVCAIVLVAGLFRFVLPPLLNTCVAMSPKGSLPWATKMLLVLIHWLEDPYIVFPALGILFVGSFAFRHFIDTPRGIRWRHHAALTFPVLGELNHKLLLARFSRSLGILVGAGVPITTCFDVIIGFIDNSAFTDRAVRPILEGIQAGAPMYKVLESTGMFPPMVVGMIKVGETTGNLAGMLTRSSQFYDEQVEHALEVFLQLIEPVMVCIMGILVCFIMVAVFTPLYSVVMAS